MHPGFVRIGEPVTQLCGVIICAGSLFCYQPPPLPPVDNVTFPIVFSDTMSGSLMPRTDSFNARVRGTSHIDFKTATTGVAGKAMRNELAALVKGVKDPATRNVTFMYNLRLPSPG